MRAPASLDQRHALLVRESWAEVGPRVRELGAVFYDRLFELDPSLRDLFAATDMASQAEKFVAMLAEAVRLVLDEEALAGLLGASGRRHADYGVTARHYRTVGEALLWALDRTLPLGMPGETREAWAAAYTRMAFLMQRGR